MTRSQIVKSAFRVLTLKLKSTKCSYDNDQSYL